MITHKLYFLLWRHVKHGKVFMDSFQVKVLTKSIFLKNSTLIKERHFLLILVE